MSEPDYLIANRANWDDRAIAHVGSPDYRVADFNDPAFLSDAIRFDARRLGRIDGLRTAHLQCHIGTDTVSLARLGAHVTGVDLSPGSIEQARALAAAAGTAVDFVVSDVYNAVAALDPVVESGRAGGHFDLVYTSLGVLCWLPDIDRWAAVVSALLRPGGRLFLRDGHPMVHAVAERADGLLAVEYPYFETDPLIWGGAETYVRTEHRITHTTTFQWSHGIGELITAVLRHGLDLTLFEEHDTAAYEAFQGRMDPLGNGEWRLRDRPERLPLTFTLGATKRS